MAACVLSMEGSQHWCKHSEEERMDTCNLDMDDPNLVLLSIS